MVNRATIGPAAAILGLLTAACSSAEEAGRLVPPTVELLDYEALLLLTNGHGTNYLCDLDHPP
jgi:hypothetical protein